MRARYHTTVAPRTLDGASVSGIQRRHASTGLRSRYARGSCALRPRRRAAEAGRPAPAAPVDRCPRTTATRSTCSTTRSSPWRSATRWTRPRARRATHASAGADADGRRGRARAGDDRDLEGRGPRALLADRPPHARPPGRLGPARDGLHAVGGPARPGGRHRARRSRRGSSARPSSSSCASSAAKGRPRARRETCASTSPPTRPRSRRRWTPPFRPKRYARRARAARMRVVAPSRGAPMARRC